MTAESEQLQAEIRAKVRAEVVERHGMTESGGKLAIKGMGGASGGTGLRVLPFVIIALAGLLCFKTIGIVNDGGYSFPFGDGTEKHPFSNFGQLVSSWRSNPTVDPIVTGSLGDEKPKDEMKTAEDKPDGEKPADGTMAKPADAKMEEGKPGEGKPEESKPANGKQADGKPAEDAIAAADAPNAGAAATPGKVPSMPASETERALMLRLQERREALEKRDQEMDLREGLMAAAEKRLEERIKDLEKAESAADGGDMGAPAPSPTAAGTPAAPGQPAAASTPSKRGPRQAIRTLVTVYETMRPKEAARVFETLDQKVLVEVVRQMNPRKMAEVMAAMSPEAAARLTVSLAADAPARPKPTGPDLTILPAGELPRLPASGGTPPAAAPTP
jgi:flagellar motility protein MotE (MotC chaperone)